MNKKVGKGWVSTQNISKYSARRCKNKEKGARGKRQGSRNKVQGSRDKVQGLKCII
jgi:hypothetical protein